MPHRRMQQTFTALAAVIAPHLRLTRSEKELKVTALAACNCDTPRLLFASGCH